MIRGKDVFMECKICGKDFSKLKSHLRIIHCIGAKEYYDSYINDGSEGICPVCGKDCHFLSLSLGYRRHCSCRCSTLDKNVQEKYRNTMIDIYGQSHNWKKGKLRDNYEKTMIKKYGVSHNWKNGKLRLSKVVPSSAEARVIEFLRNNNIKFEYQYIDERYPFGCDFYITEFDCFIELNTHPTHGNRLFNEFSKDDLEELEYLKERAETSSFYKRMVEIWTIEDPNKFKIANKNKLNFKMFYRVEDLIEFVKHLYKDF